jgi:hypothetical protein
MINLSREEVEERNRGRKTSNLNFIWDRMKPVAGVEYDDEFDESAYGDVAAYESDEEGEGGEYSHRWYCGRYF